MLYEHNRLVPNGKPLQPALPFSPSTRGLCRVGPESSDLGKSAHRPLDLGAVDVERHETNGGKKNQLTAAIYLYIYIYTYSVYIIVCLYCIILYNPFPLFQNISKRTPNTEN